ncbi:MAG TPA: TIM barrel protein [Burkholderiales bacterium]|nr:TIM barrel protein [Burkholderiales bacterium]
MLAEEAGIHLMEWTLDQDGLHENPLMTKEGRREIIELCRRHSLGIPSVTGDCFMQAPFWKAEGGARESLEKDFMAVLSACAETGISMIVVPLVDNGRLENVDQEDLLVDFLENLSGFLSEHGLRVIFESDFGPGDLGRFIARLDPVLFGINYDIGNSAALGFDPSDEFDAYVHRIVNVHVKDRKLGGTTVPLGTGDADFDAAFSGLAAARYRGNYILQTARASDGDHGGVLSRYRDMTADWLARHGA